jgi:hypothetical protein
LQPTEEEKDEAPEDQSRTEADKETELFSSLTPEEIKRVLDSVCKEVLTGVEVNLGGNIGRAV